MAKIIQFTGKYIKGNEYEELFINADCITSIVKTTDKKGDAVTLINIEPFNGIFTNQSIEEVIKLVND